MTVSERFATLVERIQPTTDELTTYNTHRLTVTKRIKSVYPGSEVHVIGSHDRGCAIHLHSDLDLLVRIKRADVRWGDRVINSRTALNSMRDELRDRFLETDIGRDQCAVVAKFGGGRFSVDVVPAFFERMTKIESLGAMRPMYSIPDGTGGWLETSPEAHNQYLVEIDRQGGGKLKRVAQLIKYWSNCRSPRTPLLNFHLEIALASAKVCSVAKSYAACVAAALALFADRKLAAHRDPLGVSGPIPAAKTDAQRELALATVKSAAERATKAVAAEARGDIAEAYRLWDLVFNGNFPAR